MVQVVKYVVLKNFMVIQLKFLLKFIILSQCILQENVNKSRNKVESCLFKLSQSDT